MVGRGLPVPPCLPTRRVSARATAQGAPILGPDPQQSPTPHAKGSGQHNLSCKGATNPMATLRPCPRTHREPRHPLALALPILELAQAAAPRQGPGGPGTAVPELVALWGHGAGTRDGEAGTGMAPHPVYKRWWEETRSQGHGRQWLLWDEALLPAGTGVPDALPQQLPGDPAPWAGRPPNGGHIGSGGAPDPAGLHLGSVPP